MKLYTEVPDLKHTIVFRNKAYWEAIVVVKDNDNESFEESIVVNFKQPTKPTVKQRNEKALEVKLKVEQQLLNPEPVEDEFDTKYEELKSLDVVRLETKVKADFVLESKTKVV